MDIMRLVFDDKHNFLFLNVPSQRMFKIFDELIINDDSDDDDEEIESKKLTPP